MQGGVCGGSLACAPPPQLWGWRRRARLGTPADALPTSQEKEEEEGISQESSEEEQ